ncbi:MAG: hypothetical protein NZO58_05990 [Gemmataceae bacterium]|nr:hypothetical protein [Gemmataceae bacterium]
MNDALLGLCNAASLVIAGIDKPERMIDRWRRRYRRETMIAVPFAKASLQNQILRHREAAPAFGVEMFADLPAGPAPAISYRCWSEYVQISTPLAPAEVVGSLHDFTISRHCPAVAQQRLAILLIVRNRRRFSRHFIYQAVKCFPLLEEGRKSERRRKPLPEGTLKLGTIVDQCRRLLQRFGPIVQTVSYVETPALFDNRVDVEHRLRPEMAVSLVLIFIAKRL